MQSYLRPHEPIHVKFGVRLFHHVLLRYGHENAKMQKRKFDESHFGTLWLCTAGNLLDQRK